MALEEALVDLQELTRRLRLECPWDREQTTRTIVPHTVEEAYEVADAAVSGSRGKLLDELGDLLFQVYFLALLLEEQGQGDLEAVARNAHEKLVRRHPHVFGGAEADSAGAVRLRWEAIKTEQAAAVGYDWPDVAGPLAKIGEELAELEDAVALAGAPAPETEPRDEAFGEIGDLLFTVVNVARRLNVDPELALRATSGRFVARVERAQQLAADAGETWTELDLAAQDAYYDRAKAELT